MIVAHFVRDMNFSFLNKVLYMCPLGKIPFMNCIAQILLIFTLFGKNNISLIYRVHNSHEDCGFEIQCEFFLDIAFLYQFTLHTSIYLNEPVKCVPCVVKTCSSANVLCVLTCLLCLRAHVPTFLACLRVKVFCMLLLAHVPSCSEFLALYGLRDHVVNCQHALPPQ